MPPCRLELKPQANEQSPLNADWGPPEPSWDGFAVSAGGFIPGASGIGGLSGGILSVVLDTDCTERTDFINTKGTKYTKFKIFISNLFAESSGDLVLIYPLMLVRDIREKSKSFQ